MARERKLASLGALLERYKTHLRAPEGAVIDVFVQVARSCGVALTKHECRYTVAARTLSVQVSAPKKIEVLLKKKHILSALEKELGFKNAPLDII